MSKSSRIIDGLKTNTLYSFCVRAKNVVGQWSDLPTVVTHTTLKDTTTPAVLSSITLLLLSGVFTLKWGKPSTLDLRGGGFKVYVYTANTPASAVLIREVGYTSDSTQIFIGEKSQDASITIAAGTTYYFWVTTLDDSGNESAKVATTPTSGSISAAGTGIGHSVLTQLDYASAAHTGFEPTVTKGNLTAGSTKITIGGTGAGALIGVGASVDVDQANLDHGSIGGLGDDDHSQYALLAGRAGGQILNLGLNSGDNGFIYSNPSKNGIITFDSSLTYNEVGRVLTLSKTSAGNTVLFYIINPNAAAGSAAGFRFDSDTVVGTLSVYSAATAGGARFNLTAADGYMLIGTTTAHQIDFYTNNALVGKFPSGGGFNVVAGFGCNSKTPQTAYASGGAVVPGAGAYGFDSAAHAAALATLVTNIRLALVANGIMS